MSKFQLRIAIGLLAILCLAGFVVWRASLPFQISRLKAGYEQIQPGMTEKELEAILAKPTYPTARIMSADGLVRGDGKGWREGPETVFVILEGGLVRDKEYQHDDPVTISELVGSWVGAGIASVKGMIASP